MSLPQNRLTGQSTSASIALELSADQARLPAWRGTRPLKRWRYVAVFCEELMACAARVQVGSAHQSFWALLWREEARLQEHTRLLRRRGAVQLEPGRLRVHDGAVELDLTLAEDAGIEARCPHGAGHVWTRKQAGVPARGTVRRDGGPARTLETLAVVDDTAGYHARVTEWWWAAGVGEDPAGTPVAFNLVEGVNDPPPAASAQCGWPARRTRSRRCASRATFRGSTAPTASGSTSSRRPSATAASVCWW